jgi:hypothetical protein
MYKRICVYVIVNIPISFFQVPGMSLRSLFHKHNVTKLDILQVKDILQVDAAGFEKA